MQKGKLAKGELMEEKLRHYFLQAGYYVIRGAKLKFQDNVITDIDIMLYGRGSSFSRHRVNVDIKNKKSPQAFERILWANGLRKILGFDECIVATSDKKPQAQQFGKIHSTLVLDGNFLAKLSTPDTEYRLSEEELFNSLNQHKSHQTYRNKTWGTLYDESKSRLLNEMDFSGVNSQLLLIQYLMTSFLSDIQKRSESLRFLCLSISHMFLITDYLMKDIAFHESEHREKLILDGLTFGNLGEEGVESIIEMAIRIAESPTSASQFKKSLDSKQNRILASFFSRNEMSKKLFDWAKQLERISFQKQPIDINQFDTNLKGIFGVYLDSFNIDRKSFFDALGKNSTDSQMKLM